MSSLIKKHLEYLGLSEKEAEVYMLLLRFSALSPTEIAKKIELKSSTVYFLLNRLMEKGLVREVKTKADKRPAYQAEDPSVFRSLAADKKREVDEHVAQSENVISELETARKNRSERPMIRFYEGKSGISLSIKEYYSTKEFSEKMDWGIYSYDLMGKIFSDKDLATFDKYRIDNNIKFRAIYTGQGEVSVGLKDQEVIKIDHEKFPIHCDIGIFEDDVRFHTLSDAPYGIVIKSREIATTMKSLINYIFALRQP